MKYVAGRIEKKEKKTRESIEDSSPVSPFNIFPARSLNFEHEKQRATLFNFLIFRENVISALVTRALRFSSG